MNAFKKFLGIFWLLIAPLIIFALINGAITNIYPESTAYKPAKTEINNPVIWIIIIAIFTPIALGLMIFGWYAFRGEYDKLPKSSKELNETNDTF